MTKIAYSLAFIIFFTACTSKKDNTQKADNEEINPAFFSNIKTVKATPSNQEIELTLTGKVEYDPERVIYYTPLVQGIIERTYFSSGDKVQKGQPLLDIKSSDLSGLLSEMISLESEMEVAKRNLQSAQSLFDDKMLSEKELLESQAGLRQAQAALERTKTDMSLYKHKGDGAFSILAPMTGYIVDKQVASGSPVSPDGGSLFTIADLSKVWITVNVYAGDLQLVQEGIPVEITALAYTGEIFSGKINALSQVFDPEEKVLKARIVMSNDDLKFKPEMQVVVKLINKTHYNFLSIPTDALIFDDNRHFVVIETEPDKFEIKEVQLQGHYQKNTYIRSGLSENDVLVVKNQLLIYAELKGK